MLFKYLRNHIKCTLHRVIEHFVYNPIEPCSVWKYLAQHNFCLSLVLAVKHMEYTKLWHTGDTESIDVCG